MAADGVERDACEQALFRYQGCRGVQCWGGREGADVVREDGA